MLSHHDAFNPTPKVERVDEKSFETFRSQEILFIKLNLGVIVLLSSLHGAFGRQLGYPSSFAVILFIARSVEQSVEWVFLTRTKNPLSPAVVRLYEFASPTAAILFAFCVVAVNQMDDAHYHVLMMLPIISTAFRLQFRWVLFFVSLASVATVVGVSLSKDVDDLDGLRELFESFTEVLTFFLVGVVVWMLSDHLRRDAVELKNYYKRLDALQSKISREERLAAIGRLASAVAHEIRNPVAAITSSLTAATDAKLSAETRSELLQIAAKESARLEKLTEDFLTYARSRPAVKRPTDVRGALEYVRSLLQSKAAECSVVISTTTEDMTALAELDEFLIHGALLNLAMNGIDASPSGCAVVIGARVIENNRDFPILEISVTGNGRPISEDVADRIFEPFFTTKPGGTGLGLSIARNVAIAHGGTLELSRNSPGDVCFSMKIPFRVESPKQFDPIRADDRTPQQPCPATPADQAMNFEVF